MLGRLAGSFVREVLIDNQYLCVREDSSTRVSLPSDTYDVDTGFTFVQDSVPEVDVGASKKD